MNKKKHIQKIVCFLIAMVLMTGCRRHNEYAKIFKMEHSDLYSMAVNSLIGATGYIGGEMPMPAAVKIIEEDNYDRKLFIYYEGGGAYNLFISQKSDDEYVYFYPDYNFIISRDNPLDEYLRVIDETIFPPEEIEKLKEDNDWNKEIDIKKCVKAEIVYEKGTGPIKYEVTKTIYDEMFGDDNSYAEYRTHFLTADDYGRSIYVFYGYKGKEDYEGYYMIALLQPDGTYDDKKGVMELMRDEYKYQDRLREFKELNNWNEPIK